MVYRRFLAGQRRHPSADGGQRVFTARSDHWHIRQQLAGGLHELCDIERHRRLSAGHFRLSWQRHRRSVLPKRPPVQHGGPWPRRQHCKLRGQLRGRLVVFTVSARQPQRQVQLWANVVRHEPQSMDGDRWERNESRTSGVCLIILS